VVVKTSFRDNPALSEELRLEIEHLRATDPDEYEHVYEGMCRQAVTGAVYRNELLAADKENRICRVPYDASKPVDTFWDLGYFDNVAICLAQSIGFEFRFIDFIQGSQQSLQYYLRELQSRPYVYGTDCLPWDGGTPSLQTGRNFSRVGLRLRRSRGSTDSPSGLLHHFGGFVHLSPGAGSNVACALARRSSSNFAS
jgi:phage terminase large subunit